MPCGAGQSVARRAGSWAFAFWAAVAPAPSASADAIAFGSNLRTAGWSTISFPGIPPASFTPGASNTLEVATNASAGLVWRTVKQAGPTAGEARWSWQVEEGVAPTDLTRRGHDDRVLAVYFVFGGKADLARGLVALRSSASVTSLVYVFGGDRPRGALLPSPHMGPRGKFVVLRPADAPRRHWFDEHVDLNADYARAFGGKPPPLLAIAISSDSDDTRGRNRARLRNLVVDYR